ELAHTTDGGRNWQRVPLDSFYDGPFYDAEVTPVAVRGDTIVAVASAPDGYLTRLIFALSTNGGRSWAMRPGPPGQTFGTNSPRAFNAVDADHWQVTNQNWLWTTSDGG